MRWPLTLSQLARLPILDRRLMPLGAYGEKLARKFLKRQGFKILQANYVCPTGEIDIVAADGQVLVFVEVKTRRSDAAADPEESVNWHKRRQVTKAARYFITQKNAHRMTARFDVVTVILPAAGKPVISHFVDAFPPTVR